MRRRLFNIAAAVSALVCLLALSAWARSTFARESIMYTAAWNPRTRTTSHAGIGVSRGGLMAWRNVTRIDAAVNTSAYATTYPRPRWERRTSANSDPLWKSSTWWAWQPPAMQRLPVGSFHYWWVGLHLSVISAAAAVVPLAWLGCAVRRRGRFRAGRCPACGYDLRATPDRCPECGRPAAGEPATARSSAPAPPPGG